MVKYFIELEEPNKQHLNLIEEVYYRPIDIDNLPKEFFIKYKDLFNRIKSYDLLHDNNNKEKKMYTRDLPKYTEEQIDFGDYVPSIDEFVYDAFMTSKIFCSEELPGISKHGMIKLIELKKEYESKYKGNTLIKDFEPYFFAIIDYFECVDNIILSKKENIYKYLNSSKIILEKQNRLNKKDLKEFNEALDYLKKHKIVIQYEPNKPIKVELPNAWFITPFNHLYNCFGPEGHKQANLIYPLNEIYKYDLIEDYRKYLLNIEEILKKGYITEFDYFNYIHWVYRIPSITQIYERALKGRTPDDLLNDFEVEEEYEFVDSSGNIVDINDYEGSPFEGDYPIDRLKDIKIKPKQPIPLTISNFDKVYEIAINVTYNKDIIKIIIGILSAHAGLYKFFEYLKKDSYDYKADLEYLKDMSIEDILVRCCGFHRVISYPDAKAIVTSCINYEEEFIEYIKRGWRIEFIEPIVLDEDTHRLKEFDKDFSLIRKMHMEGNL